jgi:predicted enzyme related to lactoylglutathione lyase
MANPIGWVEIPVTDMDRAIQFYNAVMGWDIQATPMGGVTMGWFPFDQEDTTGASGALLLNENYIPSKTDGPVVYFSCASVQNWLDNVEPAGGSIMQGKTQISPEHGYMALIIDSEGNRIAFHSNEK